MADMFDVCVVGSINLDLVATTDRLPGAGETVTGHDFAEYPGGKGLNQAVAAARAGARVAFVGAVGTDGAAQLLLDVMRSEQIDIDNVVRVQEPTGRALIGVASSGENSIIVVHGANDQARVDVLPPCRVVLAQLEVPQGTVLAALQGARSSGAVTVLNPAPARALDERLLELCDVVVPNEHEVELLGGVGHLLALGARAVVVTQGAAGATLHSVDGSHHFHSFEVTAVDTTGAGDAFCGVLAARLAMNDPLTVAMRYALAAGALSTTSAGAVPSMPTLADIERLVTTAG